MFRFPYRRPLKFILDILKDFSDIRCELTDTKVEETMQLPIELLRPCRIQLRPVNKSTLDYVILRRSIQKLGILTPLLVRPADDLYDVVEGRHRYEAALDLSLPTVPCLVREATDEEVLSLQMIAHSCRIPTTHTQDAKRLWRIIKVNKEMTVNELAHQIDRHPEWVKRRLNLIYLSKKCKKSLDAGKIGVTVAGELCKLPTSSQDTLLQQVGTMPTKDFKDLIQQEARHSRQGKQQNRREQRIEQTYHYRSLKEVKNEIENPTVAASILCSDNANTKVECFIAGLKWATCKDSTSLVEEVLRLERKRAKEEAAYLQRNENNPLPKEVKE